MATISLRNMFYPPSCRPEPLYKDVDSTLLQARQTPLAWIPVMPRLKVRAERDGTYTLIAGSPNHYQALTGFTPSAVRQRILDVASMVRSREVA